MASEEEERELEEAEKAFEEENKIVAAQQSGEEIRAVSNPKDFPYTAEKNQQILIALGFTPHWHDKDKEGNDETNFGIQILNMKIGVKFNDKNPAGKVWAYVLTADNKKDFIKNGDLKQLPFVQRYLDIQAGKKPIPEPTVTGRIIERIGKGIKIEIKEDGEKKEIFFGLGAVKRHDDGHHFIPHGFSKPSSDNQEGKMLVPRDILLPDMDSQQREAEQKVMQPAYREEAEAQQIREEQGRVPVATTIPIPAVEAPALHIFEQRISEKRAPAAMPTQAAELITKYVELLALVTEAVNAEDRIPKQEKGYANKFVFYSVKAAMENGKGGDREEA